MKRQHAVSRRAAVSLAAVAAVAACICASGPQVAEAASTQCVSSGCDLFANGPDNGYFFTTPGNVVIGMICWTDSSWYDGTNRWFYISTIYGSGRAWVSANQVRNQISVGHC